MANQGHNEGFRVLDDFHCEAIPDPAVSKATSPRQGRNEGMRVVEELVIDLGSADSLPDKQASEASENDDDREIQEAVARLLSAVGGLPSDYRSILVLRLDGMSFSEISNRLGLSVNATAARFQRLTGKLREQLPTTKDE